MSRQSKAPEHAVFFGFRRIRWKINEKMEKKLKKDCFL